MGLRRKKIEEEVKNCPQCGAEYKGYPEFCDECGYDFAEAELAETSEDATEKPDETAEKSDETTEKEEETVEETEETVEESDETAEKPEETDEKEEEGPVEAEEEVELTDWNDLENDIEFEEEDILDDEKYEPEELEEDFSDDLEEDLEDELDEEFEEEEQAENYVTALEAFEKEQVTVKVEQLDFSEAIDGPSIIAYETEEGFKVVTAPKEIIVDCLLCDEKTAKILKADYRLIDDIELKEKAELYAFLVENKAENVFGYDDIDTFYGEPASLYAKMSDIADELLETNLNLAVIAELAKASKEQQKLVAKVIKKYEIKRVTVASAKQIADGKKTEDEIKEILLKDERILELIRDENVLELLKESLEQ